MCNKSRWREQCNINFPKPSGLDQQRRHTIDRSDVKEVAVTTVERKFGDQLKGRATKTRTSREKKKKVDVFLSFEK